MNKSGRVTARACEITGTSYLHNFTECLILVTYGYDLN